MYRAPRPAHASPAPARPQGSVGVVASRLVRLRAIGLDTAALKSVTLVSPAYLQVLEVHKNTTRENPPPSCCPANPYPLRRVASHSHVQNVRMPLLRLSTHMPPSRQI